MKKIFIRPENKIPFTEQGYQKVLNEKAKLISERPEAVENLQKAREMGDLSENGYYKAARAQLSFIDGRLRHFERLIRLGVITKATGTGTVEIGSQILLNKGKNQFNYTIVGGYESDPIKNLISHISPLGRQLMGKKENDKVVVLAPAGTQTYTILKIS